MRMYLIVCAAFLLISCCGPLCAEEAQHIDGPMPEPPAPVEGIVEGPLPAGSVVLDLPCDYDWWYGCSPTAAGMLFGWWEEHGYPDVFGGNHRDWVWGRPCPSFNPAHFEDAHGVVASWDHHQSGQDHGLYYGSYRDHTPGCLADFMLTQDGGTMRSEMAWGFANFAAWDDPGTPECESYVFVPQTYSVGSSWNYDDYCAEIDAGRPVHLGLTWHQGGGHSVTGLGYNNTGGKRNVYLYTTWHSGLVEWQWENPNGWTVYGATVMRPSSEPAPEFSGYFAITHRRTGYLRVWVGVGNPAQPDWEILVWDRQGGDNVNVVRTDIDLTDAVEYLERPWYLKVTDYGSATTGYIEDFQIRLGDDRQFADETHVPIPPGGTAYAYIARETALMYVDCDAPGPTHDGTSWDTAFLAIQDAVDAATPRGEAWVADGRYVENVVMGIGVSLYGGFAGAEEGGYETELSQRDFTQNVTTIDGGQSGSCVVMAPNARVDGFTVTNGRVEGDIIDKTVGGGGFHCADLSQSGVIANNIIWANTANLGGGIFCRRSAPAITNNLIYDNAADGGGGILCSEASPTVTSNTILNNSGGWNGGGVSCWQSSDPTLTNNLMMGNSAYEGGGLFSYHSSPAATNNVIAANSASSCGGGVQSTVYSMAVLLGNTISHNSAGERGGGISCEYQSWVTASNNAVTSNTANDLGGGIYCSGSSSAVLSHNDFWGNAPHDYYGCGPGTGDISADPIFAGPDLGDFHLKLGSGCINSGDNSQPGLPETDWDGEDRILDGTVDIGADEFLILSATAPDPQPECDGPLFGEPQAGFPGWVWFSVPVTPADSPAPGDVLGFECGGKLYRYDKYLKSPLVFQPPFTDWELSVGDGYLLWLEDAVANPAYDGLSPFVPWEFEFKLGRQGWTWVGMPGLVETAGADFMSSVTVKYPADDTGEYRTAQADYDATPDNWITWGWPFWNTWRQAPETFTPYAPFGHRTCYPWVGYRVWVNVGAAVDDDDPDQVTLIWFKP